MLADDFQKFESAIRRLEFVYGKKFTDEAMQAYWRALKDLPLQQIEERIASHIRYGKFTPKPVELRPKEERPKEKDRAADAAFREGEKLANERLEELRRSNPEEWLRQVRPKVYEFGRARGMLDGQIEQKMRDYLEARGSSSVPCVGRHTH